jgi:hypothetical protein
MFTLTYVTTAVVLFVATFIWFLAVMKLKDARDAGILQTLNKSVIWIAYFILYTGLVMDIALNFILLTVAFVEIPQELLCTSRVKRLKNHGSGWRQKLAAWFCANFLSPFDPKHCSE